MKKINNIYIGNSAFFFEEDASNIMEQYIAHIKELYRDNGEELKVADVERRIAEFCKERVGENGIVNAAMVNEAIETIGIQIETPREEPWQATDTAKEEPAGETKTEEPKYESNEPWYRAMQIGNKVFRNPHEGYIGGVLAGLAAYYGISTALLRIITIILFIVEPTGLLYFVYIILWVIFPKATSIIDYTCMRRVKEKASAQTAWKNNYEQAIQQLTQPPAGGCLAMVVKLLFFLPLIPLAIAICILLVAIIVLPIFFIYIFAIGGLVTPVLLTPPFVVLGISLVTAIVVILFAVIYWILNRKGTRKPMSRWVKITLATLLVVSLCFAGTSAYRIANKYNSLNQLWETVQEDFGNLLDGDFFKYFPHGTVTMKSGQFYNKYPVATGDKRVHAAIWGKELQNCNIPFIVETIQNERGEYNVYFYRHEGPIEDIEYRIVNKDCDAYYTVEAETLNGNIYFIWDSAKNTLYSDEIYKLPAESRNSTFEKRTDAVNIDAIGYDDPFNYGNAAEKGLIPFSIFFYGNQRVPSLLVGGDENNYGSIEIAPASTYKHLEGVRMPQKATTIDNNGQKDTTQIYTNINIDEDKLNKAIDDVVTLGKRADSIIKEAHDIVSIKATEK